MEGLKMETISDTVKLFIKTTEFFLKTQSISSLRYTNNCIFSKIWPNWPLGRLQMPWVPHQSADLMKPETKLTKLTKLNMSLLFTPKYTQAIPLLCIIRPATNPKHQYLMSWEWDTTIIFLTNCPFKPVKWLAGWPAGLLATPTGTCGVTQNVGANFQMANIWNLHSWFLTYKILISEFSDEPTSDKLKRRNVYIL